MTEKKRNIAQSIRNQLTRVSVARDERLELVLIRFAFERFLFRLSKSEYSDKFILKGAFLFTFKTGQYYRPTRDMDFLSLHSNRPDDIIKAFKTICSVEVEDDGLVFETNDIDVSEIREGTSYHGLRVKFKAYLQKSRISLQFDLGFGDAVFPDIEDVEYPSLLDLPKPKIKAYPLESLISEKVEAMVDLGIQNSRMKDFYDIYSMLKTFNIDRASLQKAIEVTFTRRKTVIPKEIPIALSDEFAYDKEKNKQWQQFIAKNSLSNAPENLKDVIDELRSNLLPLFNAINDMSNRKMGVRGHKQDG